MYSSANTVERQSRTLVFSAKIKDYKELIKFRLSAMVVFSTALGFLIASPFDISWFKLIILSVSGLAITGAANAINQIIERDTDALMERTKNRPLVTGRMQVSEAVIASIIMAVGGLILMLIFLNLRSTMLAAAGLVIYSFLYTPLKTVNPIAVIVGGIAGALPPLSGYIAAVNDFTLMAGILFAIQFVWQFPHFWAIAWLKDEDYANAGIRLLPFESEKGFGTIMAMISFSLVLLPLSVLPSYFNLLSYNATILLLAASILFLMSTIILWIKRSNKAALGVLLGSIAYLPIVLFIFLIDYLV